MGETIGSTATNKRLYFEASTIIHLNTGRMDDFLPVLTERGHSLITSDLALFELADGSETKLLKKHDFMYVLAHEPVFLEGKINFYRSVGAIQDDGSTEAIEAFLRNLLRATAGSSTVKDPNTLFQSAMQELIDSVFQDLPVGTDLRLVAQLDRSREKLTEALGKIHLQDNRILTDEQLEAVRKAPKFLGNIRPPEIAKKNY